ncbi:MAG: peptide chain release factor 1 [Alphaproteobacteria bacterium]|nr:MAG: peptide chain release factor 1 [Alphaproteobacteria bacterium]
MILKEKLDKILEKFNALEERLKTPIEDSKEFVKISKEYAELEKIAIKIKEYQDFLRKKTESEKLLKDPDFKELAEIDLKDIKQNIEALEVEIKILLLPKDVDDEKNAIIEVRAGTGGEEAALFAGVLYRMYKRYADLKGWAVEEISMQQTDMGGVKEGVMVVSGKGVFARLKFESGGHRVQRVPETESSGRIHTSAATVAVLPEVDDVDIHIEEKDLKIDVFRASGAGGQHVNTTDSAVRITHIPTGVVVSCQDGRSQHKNKAQAMKVLKSHIYEAEKKRKDAERAENRKSQIGSGDRSERIRTYNFPQGRVTDHRINLTLHKVEAVVEGDALDEVIDALIADDQARKLAEASL